MIAFVFSCDGSWLGGNAVVIASDEAEAIRLLNQRLKQSGYSTESTELVSQHDCGTAVLAYFDDGEY